MLETLTRVLYGSAESEVEKLQREVQQGVGKEIQAIREAAKNAFDEEGNKILRENWQGLLSNWDKLSPEQKKFLIQFAQENNLPLPNSTPPQPAPPQPAPPQRTQEEIQESHFSRYAGVYVGGTLLAVSVGTLIWLATKD